MGNPFQDQLLKAGLVNKKQLKKAKHDKRLNRKQNKEKSPATEALNKTRQEQAAREKRTRELNLQRAEENRQREQLAQVKQLIENNKLTRDDRGEPYYFVEQNRVKKIFISTDMTEQLSQGRLAIVKSDNSYEVVTAKVAHQIYSRCREALLVLHEVLKTGEGS